MEQPELRRFYQRTSAYFGDHQAGSDPMEFVAAITGDDADAALFGVGLLHRWMADQEMVWVFHARHEGRSWGWIAERVGRTRQALWERYRDHDEQTMEE